MNQDLTTQLPIVEGLWRYLEQLSLMDPPASAYEGSKVLIHQIPDLTSKIMEETDYAAMAKEQQQELAQEPKSSRDQFTSGFATC